MYLKIKNSAAIASILALTACGGSDTPEEEPEVLLNVDVSSSVKKCSVGTDENIFLCASTIAVERGYEVRPITGWSHTIGIKESIVVREVRVKDAAPDDHQIIYEFVEQTSSEHDELGTIYRIEDYPLTYHSFEIDEDGDYSVSGYKFSCGNGVDCDTLIDMGQSGGLVFFEFTLTGGDIPITLTSWG